MLIKILLFLFSFQFLINHCLLKFIFQLFQNFFFVFSFIELNFFTFRLMRLLILERLEKFNIIELAFNRMLDVLFMRYSLPWVLWIFKGLIALIYLIQLMHCIVKILIVSFLPCFRVHCFKRGCLLDVWMLIRSPFFWIFFWFIINYNVTFFISSFY